jgi:hypothetical protein
VSVTLYEIGKQNTEDVKCGSVELCVCGCVCGCVRGVCGCARGCVHGVCGCVRGCVCGCGGGGKGLLELARHRC